MLGILDYFKIGAGIAAGVMVYHLYAISIGYPAAARSAKAGMVTLFERDALASQLAEEKRLRLAGSQALEEYRKRAAAALTAEQADNDRMEQEIADYEAKLADANRCRITPDLRKWLQSK